MRSFNIDHAMLICFLIIGIILFICFFGESVVEGLSELVDYFFSEERETKIRQKRRKRKWKSGIRQLRRTDETMQGKSGRYGRKVEKDTLDIAAHTLMIHQELMEEMYQEAAPSVRKVVQNVKKRH